MGQWCSHIYVHTYQCFPHFKNINYGFRGKLSKFLGFFLKLCLSYCLELRDNNYLGIFNIFLELIWWNLEIQWLVDQISVSEEKRWIKFNTGCEDLDSSLEEGFQARQKTQHLYPVCCNLIFLTTCPLASEQLVGLWGFTFVLITGSFWIFKRLEKKLCLRRIPRLWQSKTSKFILYQLQVSNEKI